MATNIILWSGAANPNDIILRDPTSVTQTISPTAIASAEAFGTALIIIQQFISPTGITSAEAFGTPTIVQQQFVSPSGIASAEAFGNPVLIIQQFVSPSGIASAESFGTPTVFSSQTVIPSGIASAEAFGTPVVFLLTQFVIPSAIASAEAFGTPTIGLYISPSGIASRETFGTPTLSNVGLIVVSGIASEEAFGTPTIRNPRPVRPPSRNTIVVPCAVKSCAVSPGDLTLYNLQDALLFNGVPLSILAQCPTGYFCPPGVFPHVFTYPPGTFSVFQPPANQPFSSVLSATGCEGIVTRVAPAGASAAAIAVLANSIINELAAQQARCDAITIAGPPLPRAIALSSVDAYTCLNVDFAATVTASASPSGAPYTMTLQNAPAWMTAVQNPSGTQLILGGTPAAFGVVTFTITASAAGYYGAKNYSVEVIGIANSSPLPAATNGNAYSEYLAADNIPGVTTLWTVTSGSLPPGLSINQNTWNLEGTPTTDGNYSFTLTFTTELASCSKAFTLEVVAASACPFDSISWTAPVLSGNATGSNGVGTFTALDTPNGSSPFESQTEFNGSFVYTGPLYAATLRWAVTQFDGDNVRGEALITSDIDGVLLSQALVNPSSGIYDWAFNLPASAGAVITVYIICRAGFVDFGPGTGTVNVIGDFCP